MGLKFCSLSFQEKKRKDVFWDPELLAAISMGVLHLAPLNCSDILLSAVVLPPTSSQDLQAAVLWHRTTSCLAQHSPAPCLKWGSLGC